jgi:hypothetical protein
MDFESQYGQNFSVLDVQTTSDVHSVSYPFGTGGSLPGVKSVGA